MYPNYNVTILSKWKLALMENKTSSQGNEEW